MFVKYNEVGTGEVTQRLRVLATLTEDQVQSAAPAWQPTSLEVKSTVYTDIHAGQNT